MTTFSRIFATFLFTIIFCDAQPNRGLDLGKVCIGKPDGTIVPLSEQSCLKLHILCKNGLSMISRCPEPLYIDPIKAKCAEKQNITICVLLEPTKIPNTTSKTPTSTTESKLVANPVANSTAAKKESMALREIDGATSLCRRIQRKHNASCSVFESCCDFYCVNASQPTCNKISGDGFNNVTLTTNATSDNKVPGEALPSIDNNEPMCNCEQLHVYNFNQQTTNECRTRSQDCLQFSMCCALRGCPAIYQECNSNENHQNFSNNTTTATVISSNEAWKAQAKCFC